MNWLRFKKGYYTFSFILILIGTFFVLKGGLQPSVEFTGGAILRVSSSDQNFEKLKTAATESLPEEELEVTQEQDGDYTLHLEPKTNAQKDELVASIEEKTGWTLQEKNFQTVGPSVGKELLKKTSVAIALAVTVILLYVWAQFKDWRFGLGAILAMLHDTVILIGAYAGLGLVFGAKTDVLFVTAVLTVLSFSIHDTIVLFDQVREVQKKQPKSTFIEVSNLATTQTLGRSINNSVTILIMLSTLLLLGGESLRWFTGALLIGTFVGTYSSTFMALPLVVELQRFGRK